MEVVIFRIVGISPVIQNNPANMATAKPDGLRGKKTYVPAEEAEAACYRNERGELYIPTAAFRAAMLGACSFRKIGKMSASKAISSSVFPTETQAILLDKTTLNPITEFKIHSCRAVVNRAGIIRNRPMIENWCCDLALEIDTEMIPNLGVVSEVLNLSGRISGILELRPNRRGTYGRFSIATPTDIP